MSFGHPLLLLTLLVVPAAAGLYALSQRRRARHAVRFTNLDVLAEVAGGRSWRRIVPPVLLALALALLAVAVARPRARTLVPAPGSTVILVMDASRSMDARDVRPSRLGAAQEAVGTFLDRVPKNVRVGLIVFAGEAQVGAPPTTDRELVRQAVEQVGRFSGYGGTAIGDALARAVELGQASLGSRGLTGVGAAPESPPRARGRVSILFLSDGRQTRGLLLPLEGAQRAKDAGMPVYTIALGTRNATLPGLGQGFGGSFPFGRPNLSPDPVTLSAISRLTGGRFFRARSAEALQSAYAALGSRLGRKAGEREITYAFLAGAAALLVAAGVLSTLWSPRIP